MSQLKHSGVYVDVGLKSYTTIAVIKNDRLMNVTNLSSNTDFDEVVSVIVVLLQLYDMGSNHLKAYRFPKLEERVQTILNRKPD